MRKTWPLWLLAIIVIFACSPTTQIQDSVSLALTQTQAARPTSFPTFTPGPTRTTIPTRTPLGGGPLPVITPGYPAPVETEIGSPTPTIEATNDSGPQATITPPPASQPTATSGSGYPAPATATQGSGGGYPPPSVSTFTASPTASNTPTTPTTTPTPTIDPLFTPTLTPSPTITPSPTVTPTPNGNVTPTASTTPTPSTTSTRTLTPTRTPGPSPTPTVTLTPTPSLPDLTTLIIDTDDLNAFSNIWRDPPVDFTDDLIALGGSVCDVSCIGLEWTSIDYLDTLDFTAYRTIDFDDAIQTAYSAQFLYLAQGFQLEPLPPGLTLPTHTWAASKWNQSFVIYTSQGPAVLSYFWYADSPIPAQDTIALLAQYMDLQAEILRLNGYITINPIATPLP